MESTSFRLLEQWPDVGNIKCVLSLVLDSLLDAPLPMCFPLLCSQNTPGTRKLTDNINVFFYSECLEVQEHEVPIDSMSRRWSLLKYGATNGRREGTTSKTKQSPLASFMAMLINWLWQQMPMIPELSRLRQEDCHKCEPNLSFLLRPVLKTKLLIYPLEQNPY